MPRIRTVKPAFWLDEDLGTIKRDARLLYIGLWNHSDDRGVFEWRPGKIKIEVFPYDTDVKSETVSSWLNMLKSIGNIFYFEEKGKPFGYIPTFVSHQKIDKPSPGQYLTSSLPDVTIEPSPRTPETSEPVATEGNSKVKEKEKEGTRTITEKKVYGICNNVWLSDEEHKKLVEKFGEAGGKARIDKLSTYIGSKGDKYRSHYATVLNWDNKDGETNGTKNGKPITGLKIINGSDGQ